MSPTRIDDPNLRLDERAPARPRPSRRAFLASAAVTVGLPFLESLGGRKAADAAGPRPVRLVAWHIPNGVWRPTWFPKTDGADYELSPTLAPLAALEKKLLVFSGVQNNAASVVPGAHGLGVAGMLTGVRGTKIPTVQVGISVDQAYAQSLGKTTRIQSLQLGITNRMYADLGHPAIYNGCISWASATQPLQPVIQPGVVFDQIFDGERPDASTADRQRRTALRTSVLDHVLGEAKALESRLGVTDRRKLGEYLSSVRAVESEIQTAIAPGCGSSMTRPENSGFDGPTLVRLMNDLMLLALQCDATRVITFMLGNGGSSCFSRFPWLGINQDHHGLAHAENGTALSAIEKWEIEQLAYFCGKLDAIDDGGSTMLDNSLVFLSSEIDTGNGHGQDNKGILLLGSAGGVIQTGRHLRYAGEPQANLFITMLNALGVPARTFGAAGKRPLPGLM
jgi:hypothetical protein